MAEVATNSVAQPMYLVDPATGTPYVAGGGSGATSVQGNAASGTTTAANPITVAGRYNATLPTVGTGERSELQTTARGELFVAISNGSTQAGVLAPSADNTVQANGLSVIARPYAFNGATWDRQRIGITATSRLVSSAGTTNATLASATARFFYAASGQNTNAAARYLKIYDKATAPTVGTDVPIWTEYLPPSSKFNIAFPAPMKLANGLAYAITAQAADTDTTVIGAGDIMGLNFGFTA